MPEDDDEHYFPYPNMGSTNYIDYMDLLPEEFIAPDNQVEQVLYLRNQGQGQDRINHFLRVGYFAEKFQEDIVYQRTFYLDENCHQDYAAKLVPRAVGYSAALLNYFFRGRLETRHLMVKHGAGFGISGIQLDVHNTTPPLTGGQSVEPMGAGRLDLACRYIDPVTGGWAGHVAAGVYSVTDADDPINHGFVTIAGNFTDAADLPAPIPVGARQITFTLVFSGKLGHEEDAVAGAVVDTTVFIIHPPGPRWQTGPCWPMSLKAAPTVTARIPNGLLHCMI